MVGGFDLHVVVAHAPVEGSEDQEMEECWSDVNKAFAVVGGGAERLLSDRRKSRLVDGVPSSAVGESWPQKDTKNGEMLKCLAERQKLFRASAKFSRPQASWHGTGSRGELTSQVWSTFSAARLVGSHPLHSYGLGPATRDDHTPITPRPNCNLFNSEE